MVLLVAFARPVLAAEAEVEQARTHVRKATAAYNLGRYTEAAQEYEAAYERSLDPNMLFNIGQAWRLAGERQKALTAYRSYLRNVTKGEHRSMAEAKIKELEEQAAAQPAPMVRPVETAPATAPPAAAALPSAAPLAADRAPASLLQPPGEATVSSQNTPPAGASDSATRPFYVRWPFWTGVGVLVAAGVVAGILLTSKKDDLSMPPTTYGVKHY